ncbi:MAG TPA: SDR family oxidoreductase, partial [Pseudomonadales bacterium]
MTTLAQMTGKICLVTGANSGIGFETAKALAKMGAHVVMACRNEAKARVAQQDIIKASKNPDVDLLIVDMSSLDSVRELAQTIKKNYQRLDVLINNAGVMLSKRQLSADGYEMQYAVHHLGPFLLTHLLLDLLKASASSSSSARIINVSSKLHSMANIEFDNLQAEKKFGLLKAYGMSKLALLMFTYSLAERLKGSGVTVNALHPGVIGSNLGGIPGFIKIFMKSPKRGAETSVFLASSPSVENVSGKYFSNCKPVNSSTASY